MSKVHHINCGSLHVPRLGRAVCHCLLLEDGSGLALVDTGIGLLDCQNPAQRLGQGLIDMAGFQFDEDDTAVRRVEQLGFQATDVKHAVITHWDPDHVGGLADFPHAQVHISQEEQHSVYKGHYRYLPTQSAHGPRLRTYHKSSEKWFGLECRSVSLGFRSQVLLIPLFGHTNGHCGVAIQQGEKWILHAGDAYYLRSEMTQKDHPVSALAEKRADNNSQRLTSLAQVQRLIAEHSDQIEVFSYHDPDELLETGG